MRKLSYSNAALDDFEMIRARYSQPGAGQKAAKVLSSVIATIERLCKDQWCRSGRELEQGDRLLVVSGHTILYRLKSDQVLILRVYQPGQDRPA